MLVLFAAVSNNGEKKITTTVFVFSEAIREERMGEKVNAKFVYLLLYEKWLEKIYSIAHVEN